MTNLEIAILFLFSLFLVVMPLPLRSPPRPLCAAQFNLVNYACGTLQVGPFPPPSPSQVHSRSSRRSHGHSSSRRSHGHSSSSGSHSHVSSRGSHGHSSSSGSHGHSSSSRRSRTREHRHRHRRGHRHGSNAQSYCCQWLNQVDTECVCDLLVHLPVFLSRPSHQYTIVVGDTCSVDFTCPGRLVP